MAELITVPSVGKSVTAMRIACWIKREGEAVAAGSPLFELETEKANLQVVAERAGTVLKILVPVGATVAPGDPLAIVGQPDEDLSGLLSELAISNAHREASLAKALLRRHP